MTQYIVSGAAAKVSIGGAGGNRVAALLRHGDVVPEGVAEDQLKRLVDRGLIEKNKDVVSLPEGDPSEKWTVAQLELFATEKDIDLGSASSKPEKLAVIVEAITKPGE